MKSKNTLLAAFLGKLSPNMQKQFVDELNDFATTESGQPAVLTLEGLRNYTGVSETLTEEEAEDKRQAELGERMLQSLKTPGMDTLEGRQASNVNIQEI